MTQPHAPKALNNIRRRPQLLFTLSKALLIVFITICILTLWWPSVAAWRMTAMSAMAVWACWLLAATAADKRRLRGNYIYIALAAMLTSASWHGLREGLSKISSWPTPLLGQLSGSIAVQILILAVVTLLCDELITHRRRYNLLIGIASAAAAAMAMAISTRAEGTLMLAFLLAAGISLIASALVEVAAAWRAGSESALRDISHIQLADPSESCPAGRVLTTAISVILILTAIASALLIFANRGELGSWLSVTGLGDEALEAVGDASAGFFWLAAMLGAPAAIAPIAITAISAAGWLTHSFKHRPSGRVISDSLTVAAIIFATAAWMSPMGLFCPAVNVLMAFLWSALAARRTTRETGPTHSGWFLLAAVGWGCALLAVLTKMGLLVWMLGKIRHRDTILHIFFGWAITQTLMLAVGRRWWRIVAAVAISLAISGLGELAQRLWTARSYELADFLAHAAGTAAALILYLLCRATGVGPTIAWWRK